MKKIFTTAEVPGTRRVSPRSYTHAIVGRLDGTHSAETRQRYEAANRDRSIAWNRKIWQAEQRLAEAELGTPYRALNGYDVQPTAQGITLAKAFMARHASPEAHQAHLDAEMTAEIAQAQSAPLGPLEVLQWNQSADNANKALAGFAKHHSDLRVVQTVQV